jgi:hypothetical protein
MNLPSFFPFWILPLTTVTWLRAYNYLLRLIFPSDNNLLHVQIGSSHENAHLVSFSFGIERRPECLEKGRLTAIFLQLGRAIFRGMLLRNALLESSVDQLVSDRIRNSI